MKISIISVFPEIHELFTSTSLVGRAVDQGIISFNFVRFSDLCKPKERIDEPICGPGAGMILKPEVVEGAINLAQKQHGKGFVIFFSPHGKVLNQPLLRQMAVNIFASNKKSLDQNDENAEFVTEKYDHLILVCGRYEGIDARIEEHYADIIISIGDYVLMGGDLPAQVFLEGLLRLIPGVVGKQESIDQDSFEGPFLDYPHYGLPVKWKESEIPSILRSGNHAAIEEWRTSEAAKRTALNRFDWFASHQSTNKQVEQIKQFIPPHYLAIMHTQVLVKSDNNTLRVGETSIPSLDIHDIARSCTTYGIKNFFIVSPLIDQQDIVGTFIDFWLSPDGGEYNKNRQQAVKKIKQAYSYDEMIKKIREYEGLEPIVIATSARSSSQKTILDYSSQGTAWQNNRPVLLLFGTGQGLSDDLIEKCDYILSPIQGMTDYNHLSVRSAAAIILDRWLGLHQKIEFSSKKKGN